MPSSASGPEPRNRVHLTADLPAPPDAVFTFMTERFDEIWPGRMEHVREGSDPAEPLGLGFVRRMHPPGSPALEEEITVHERPRLIEYRVINEARFRNHRGRIALSERGGGTRLDYTIAYDYRPAFAGPLTAAILKATWRLHASRRLRAAFPRR